MKQKKLRNVLSLMLIFSLVVSLVVPQFLTAETVSSQQVPATVRRVSVHDPSIVKADGMYYVFGSHLADAKSSDLMSWTQMNRDWNFRNGDSWKNDSVYGDVLTNLSEPFLWAGYNDGDHMTADTLLGVWAPDVIYNPDYKWSETEKGAYMLYFSTSSTWRRSCIGYAVSKNVEGPYQYVDTLIYSGFTKNGAVDGGGNRNTKWDNSYLNLKELIDQNRISGISDKWFTNEGWNEKYAPNAIDPTVFYGKDGGLYMVYGSWSGGLFILELDKETGDARYPGTDGTEPVSGNFTDRYFGTHIAGGNHESGEGPYILYDEETDYYYLYETYGGLTAAGGYNMRMFRSRNVYGPYLDASGKNAKDSGRNSNNYGIKLIGNYAFSNQPGYRAAGHNSALIDDDGERYLFYHQRFNQPQNQTEAHEVRVRKQYMNEDNWPVTAVYEYRGESISHYDNDAVVGKYEIINHGTTTDGNMIAPQKIDLYADGTIDGDVSGTWEKSTGTGKEYDYITLKMGSTTYKGVLYEQFNEEAAPKSVMTFSAIGNDNTCLWGTRTGNSSGVGDYRDNLIYGYDFEMDPSNPNKINPVSQSEKTGQATLVGTAAIEEDAERGNVLHIQNAPGAKQVNYLRLPDNTLNTVTSDGFTVSMWVNAGTDVAAPSALFEANRNGSQNAYPMTRISANLKSHINANGYIDCVPDSETLLTRNQWHHVAYSVNTGEISTYLDGKKIKTESKDINGCFNSADDYSIHKAVNVTVGAGVIWNDEDIRDAKFDNIAVYNKTLSAQEIETLHDGNDSASFLEDSLIYGFDFESGTCGGKIAPIEGSAKTDSAELKGSTTIKTDPVRGRVLSIANPKGVKSNSYLRLPADVLTTVTNDGFTVSMWANIGENTFGHSALFEANLNNTAGGWPMTRISTNLIARINANAYSDTEGIGATDDEREKPFAVNEWHYITYSVNTKGIWVYLDGELLQTAPKDLTNCFNSVLNDSIQKAVYTTIGSGRIFDDEDVQEAMFDNVAFYNTALSAAQIKKMYQSESGEEPDPPAPTPDTTEGPTATPDTTEGPTPTPDNTATPTKKPDNTSAPTKKPDNTSAPTQKPDQTVSPSPDGNLPAALKGTVSLAEASGKITKANTDKGDPKGSVFSVLRLKGKGGKKSVTLSWSKVKGADGYIIYGSLCGKKMKEIKRVSAAKKSISLKKLKKGKYYKYIVTAYKKIGSEIRIVTQSKSVHVCTTGGKVANPVKISAKKKLTIKKGRTKKISAKIKPAKKVKVHIARYRYESTNPKVAAVNKKGTIKAKKKGSCSVYVYSQNGLFVKINVKVKK